MIPTSFVNAPKQGIDESLFLMPKSAYENSVITH